MLTHNGYVYSTEVDEDEDCRKIDHYVTTPEGVRKPIPFSPYEVMSRKSFETWVSMGCPSSKGWVGSDRVVVNFSNDTLERVADIASRAGISFSDDAALRTAYAMSLLES